jgi:hypothetical protein
MTTPPAAEPDVELGAFLARLRDERLLFFPVRHHSPACAWHLQRLIAEAKPASILVEGPETFDRFLPQLASAETVAPIAVYSQLVEKGGRDGDKRERRWGSFYPLCDYSPELVAVRAGAAAGARVSFFDLDYPRQVRSEERARDEKGRLTSLLADAYLQENVYLRELAARRGCRDPHELWDRLFESRYRDDDSASFVRQVAAYCWFARAHTPRERLARDGTLRREAHMWQRLQRELRRLRRSGAAGPLLVVTGGFHTPALALGWPRAEEPELPPPAAPAQTLETLIPYTFAQLDALNGYAAGMPSPGFYQAVWQAAGPDGRASFEAAALLLLTELPARLRASQASLQLSTADSIAAFTQALLLAQARGNPGPSREDLLDGMRSCFVKGELDVEGQLVLGLALELMRGDAVGRLPADAELHPLVADFRRQAQALGLELGTATPREAALEIYRKPRHRELSRLFHRLAFLEVPFARFVGGPDFVGGNDLDLQVERWEHAWSPQTESALIDKTLYGSTIADACVGLLRERLERLREEHGEIGALEAVRALMVCLRLDLGEHLGELVVSARDRLAEESALARCVEAAAQLQTLVRFPGPFRQAALPEVERLALDAYERSSLLVRDLPRCSPAAAPEALVALARLREVVLEATADATPVPSPADAGEVASDNAASVRLDPALLWEAAHAALAAPRAPEAVRGGLAGLLFAGGQLDAAALERQVLAGLHGQGPEGSTAPAYLQGLFALCRELTWQHPALMRRVDELLAQLDEGEFHRALPHLRLAFASHTPRETDRVARLLQELHGSATAIDWYQRTHDETLVAANVALAARIADCLRRDGLAHFLEEP